MADVTNLDPLRREARTLLRQVRSDDETARDRARRVLGSRMTSRFVLADALHVVAQEHGAASWPELVARAKRGPIRFALDQELDASSLAEIEVETDLAYPDGTPVVIAVKQRDRRFMLDDRGEAVARAGRPPGWAEAAERAVRRYGLNVSPTTGVVFVPAVGRRDLERLALRVAQASLDVLEALLELDERERPHG